MNELFHFFSTFALIQTSFPASAPHAGLIAAGVTLIDLDHLPYWLRSRKEISQTLRRGLSVECRSVLHELGGIILFTLLAGLALMVGVGVALVSAVYFSVMLHLAVDFTTGSSRPFRPLSDREVRSPLAPTTLRQQVALQTVGTVLVAALFLSL